MPRKISTINLFLSALFLLTTVLPVQAFSYEVKTGASQLERVDESLGYEPVIYKKIRCPRCGIEFYYIHGKESPHSHWVHYEFSEKELERSVPDFRSASSFRSTPDSKEAQEIKKQGEEKGWFGLLTQKIDKEEIKKQFSSEEKRREGDFSISQLKELQVKYYRLRQKLTCPYDGYSFFPEGDAVEDMKLMSSFLDSQEASLIEKNFAKSIPFGVSKDIKQFGYDLFIIPEDFEKQREKTIGAKESEDRLGTFDLLKTALSPTTSSAFTPQFISSQTAVIPVDPDYIIGPGDTLVINIWGSVQESFPVQVDREGKIMLPKAGPLYLWGYKFKDVERRIRERLNLFYTNFSMDVSMGKLRNIQVYVMGEVRKPGTYVINSQSNIFQVLYAASGPTKIGSLRRIKIIHPDGKEDKVDLYPFLLEGEKLGHSTIQSGDTIFVPTIGDVVAIAGGVKRPAIYETRSDLLVGDLLNFAGGITPTGDLQRLQVERVENNERRVMFDIELKRSPDGEFSLKDVSLRNGDFVIVSPIVRLKHDFVSVVGNVERPGDYALSENMKVSDLVQRTKGFLPSTYLHRAEIARVTRDRTRQIISVDLEKILRGVKEEDILLEEWDILFIYSESEINPPTFVEIDGAINRPGKYELTPHMKISDLIFKAGGVKMDEIIRGAELFHIMPGEEPIVREILIEKIKDDTIISIDKDMILRAGDVLFIKSEPRLTKRRLVSIKGEVRFPGTYSIREGERLSSLIERGGGFTKEAFLEGGFFTRKSIKEVQEKMRERFIQKEHEMLVGEQQAVLLRKGMEGGVGQVTESLKLREEMLKSLSSAEIEGRMVVTVKNLSELRGSKYDIVLEDGDTLTIPHLPSVIMVIGSVNNPISVAFEEGRGVEYYINRTGGLTKHADKSGIYVIRANGEAVSKFMMSKRVERGDTIVVPQEFKYRTPPGYLLRDTVEILSRIAVGVGIIAALD